MLQKTILFAKMRKNISYISFAFCFFFIKKAQKPHKNRLNCCCEANITKSKEISSALQKFLKGARYA